MSAIGVIAEFNPIHTGHVYLLSEAKKHGTVVAVISGNFVQRGDIAIAEKRVRAKAALLCGADLVLELPVTYSMSTAQNFALGGVFTLKAMGCDSLIFGSECGDITELEKACGVLKSGKFSEEAEKLLGSGMTFAAAREKAAELAGLDSGVLKGANNNLAVEYMLAAENIGADFEYFTVKRQGAVHDSQISCKGFASASLLRKKLLEGDYGFCRKYIPENVSGLFTEENTADIKRIENAVLAVLRCRSIQELKGLPDISEGIENKLFSAIRVAKSLDELYNTVKVKRYTHARIRRLALNAFIGTDSAFFMKPPPYVRVLGFNPRGEALLKKNASASPVPVITRAAQTAALNAGALGLFQTECRAADLYSLALKKIKPCGTEYTAKIIKTEC